MLSCRTSLNEDSASRGLDWELEALPLEYPTQVLSVSWNDLPFRHHLLGIVNPKEVRVQYSLDDTGDHGDGIEMARLGEISVNPVRNVQCSVNAQGKEVVSGNRFCFASPLQHEQLWQYGDTFEPQGKGPEDLRDGPFVRENDGKDR